MKNSLKYIAGMLIAAIAITACSPEEYTGADGNIPQVSDYADNFKVTVDQETNYAYFEFTSAPGITPVWIIDGTTYSSAFGFSKYYRKKGSYTAECKVKNRNGFSDGTLERNFVVEKTKMTGFGGFDYDSEYNMWKKAIIQAPTFWYAPDWSQIADPQYIMNNGAYAVTLPAATTDTWQAQMALLSDISTEADKSYDFSVIFTSTLDHPHVMVKLVDSTDDGVYYVEQTIALTANEPVAFWKYGLPGINITNLKLVLDFGGNAAGSVISIENIVLKDHANDDGTEVPDEEIEPDPTWSAVDSPDNIWYGVPFTNTFYYAPGWSPLPNPSLTINGTEYTVNFPEATFEQWQNQVAFVTDDLTLSATENYDFRASFTASNEIKKVTVKLCQDGENDNPILFVLNNDLPAGEEVIVKSINTAGVDISKAKLVLDFGGNSANTSVVIKDVILQKHKD